MPENDQQSIALGNIGFRGDAVKLLQRKVDKHDFYEVIKNKVNQNELEMVMRLIEIMHKQMKQLSYLIT